MKAVLVNDTSKSGHFGGFLVMDALRKQCMRTGIQLVKTIPVTCRNYLQEIPRNIDLVIVNGEGSLHHNRRNDLIDVANHFPAALINTVFDRNDYCEGLNKFRLISVRESLSHGALKRFKIDSVITPDIMFGSDLVGSSRVDLQACKLEYSIVSPK